MLICKATIYEHSIEFKSFNNYVDKSLAEYSLIRILDHI